MSSWYSEPDSSGTGSQDLPARPRGEQRRQQTDPSTGDVSRTMGEDSVGLAAPEAGIEVVHRPRERRPEEAPPVFRGEPGTPMTRRSQSRRSGADRPRTTSSVPVASAPSPIPPPAAAAGTGGAPEWWSTAVADGEQAAPTGAAPIAAPASSASPAPTIGPARSSAESSWPKLLAVAAWPALGAGLMLPDWPGGSLLSVVPSWSLFALLCLVLVTGAVLIGPGRRTTGSWRLGAVGAGGLMLFWVLLVLPGIATNAGFALTLATASVVAAMWLAPGRPR
jgi:hypothetical protein